MFGSNVLEVGIGLVFVFLGVSLVCTAINELVAIAFASRSRDLERGIRNMLDGSSVFPLRWWTRLWLKWKGVSAAPPAGNWADVFFNHQLINGTSKDGERPSYIPSKNFASVLTHLVAASAKASAAPGGAPIDVASRAGATALFGLASFDDIEKMIQSISSERIKEALLPLLQDARGDLTSGVSAVKKFTDRIEIWFDQAMDGVGGWYKRRTQWILLIVALIVSGAMNIDSVAICQRLARDSTLRASIVAVAQKAAATQPTSGQSMPVGVAESDAIDKIGTSVRKIDELGIPIGWTRSEYKSMFSVPVPDCADETTWNWGAIMSKISGLLATAFAASLGAPFWFDTLNKFMSVRGAGKAPEESPKDPKVILQPQGPKGS